MIRRLAWLALTAALLGCKSAAPPGTDPFFGRTTVPPPATGAAAPPGFAQPGAMQPGLSPASPIGGGPIAGSSPSWGSPAAGAPAGNSPYANGLPYGNSAGAPTSPSGGYPQPSTNASTWPWAPPSSNAGAPTAATPNNSGAWGGQAANPNAPSWGQAGQPVSGSGTWNGNGHPGTGTPWNGNSWTQTPTNRLGTTPPATQQGGSLGPASPPAGAWPQGNSGAGVSPPGANPWPGGLAPYSPPANGMRGASSAPPYGQNNASPLSAPAWNQNTTSNDLRQPPWPSQQAAAVPARPLGSFAGAPVEAAAETGTPPTGMAGRPVTNDPASVVLSRDPIVRTISPPPRDASRAASGPGDAAGQNAGAWAATTPSQPSVPTANAARATPTRMNILDLPDVDGAPSSTRAGAIESNYRSAATTPAYGASVGPRTSSEPATGSDLRGAAATTQAAGPSPQTTAGGSAQATAPGWQKTNFKADAPFGYDTNYQWLRGRLENNGSSSTWRVAYVPPYAPADQYGGVLPIANPTALGGYSPGQQVEVRGRLVRVWSRGALTHAFYVAEAQRIDAQ